MLDVHDLHVYYGEIHALKGISFRVTEGEIVTLLGNNGAGKSTTLKTLSGLLAPRTGTVLLDGASLAGAPPHGVVQRGITHVPEGRRIFNRLTVQENLLALVPGPRRLVTREQIFEYFPVLAERRRQLAGYLSGGERQMLALATALLCQPAMPLVDELSQIPLRHDRVADIHPRELDLLRQGPLQ